MNLDGIDPVIWEAFRREVAKYPSMNNASGTVVGVVTSVVFVAERQPDEQQ